MNDSGSAKAVAASENDTPCFARFRLALVGSHSNRIVPLWVSVRAANVPPFSGRDAAELASRLYARRPCPFATACSAVPRIVSFQRDPGPEQGFSKISSLPRMSRIASRIGCRLS